MNYVGVDSSDIAKERRYYESIKNLKEVISVCDEINVYDNTFKFEQIAYINNEKIIWEIDKLPNWSNEFLK